MVIQPNRLNVKTTSVKKIVAERDFKKKIPQQNTLISKNNELTSTRCLNIASCPWLTILNIKMISPYVPTILKRED